MKESFLGLIIDILLYYIVLRIFSKIDSKLDESKGCRTDFLFFSFLILGFIFSLVGFYFLISLLIHLALYYLWLIWENLQKGILFRMPFFIYFFIHTVFVSYASSTFSSLKICIILKFIFSFSSRKLA